MISVEELLILAQSMIVLAGGGCGTNKTSGANTGCK